MFQVYRPSAGDFIFTPYLTTGVGFSIGIIANGVFRQVDDLGVRPHTWGRDQFNNSNCSHLNVKGSIGALPVGGNIIYSTFQVPTGPTSFTSHRRVQIGDHVASHLSYWGIDTEINFSYYDRWWDSPHLSYRAIIKYLSPFRVRIIFEMKARNADGVVTWSHLLGGFEELNPTRSGRRASWVQYQKISDIPDWLEMPFGFSDLHKSTLMGTYNDTRISIPDLVSRTKKLRDHCRSNDLSSFGQLSVDAAQALKVFDGQLVLYLRDFLSIRDTVVSFAKGLAERTLKGVSTAYLSYRYGLKLTYRDTVDLLSTTRSLRDGSKGYNSSRSRLQRTTMFSVFSTPIQISHTYNMKLYVRDYPDFVVEMLQTLMVADFFPTLELVWDAIPFSFVVDWFTNVGDILEAIDSNTLLSTYKVLSCMYSRTSTCRIPFQDLFPELGESFYGEFEVSIYDRHISRTPPPFFVDFSTPRTFKNYVEGAALIAQRSRV